MSSTCSKKRKLSHRPRRAVVIQHHIEGEETIEHTSIQRWSSGQQMVSRSIQNVGLPLQPTQCECEAPEQERDLLQASPQIHTKPKHGASGYFEELQKFKPIFIRSFMSRHTHPHIKEHCPNHLELLASYRCTVCFHAPLACELCIVESHRMSPFHPIEHWTGTHFERYSLKQAGLDIDLGHEGRICPHRPRDHFKINMVIVDITGIHEVSVVYCHCPGRLSLVEQLLQARLWPATTTSPSTCFTFSLLEHFHQYTLVSRNSTLDFWQILCRVTDNDFPETVPDRYLQLLRCSRWYRIIKALEQSGQSLNIDNHLKTTRRRGLIAIPCITCPEPGFNMPENWENEPQTNSFVHRLFLHQDANFRNQLKNKPKRDPDDIALYEGRCFYPPESEYQAYLKTVTHKEEKSDCSNHKAVNLQHVLKFRYMDVTGIMAIVCRHDCFRPGGQTDLQKGERYANADYALACALSWVPVPKEIAHTYDIACQYSKNLISRFEAHFPSLVPTVSRIHHAIPKKHIVGHVEECQLRLSCNYLPGFGRVYGEGIEAIWAHDNPQTTSLREMNAGHRHDVTDDNHWDWNFRKIQRLATSTYEHFVTGLDEYSEAAVIFQAASMLGIDPRVL